MVEHCVVQHDDARARERTAVDLTVQAVIAEVVEAHIRIAVTDLHAATMAKSAKESGGVFIPVALPGLIAATIFAFTVSWAQFLYPLAFTTSADQLVLPVGIITALAGGPVFVWLLVRRGTAAMQVPLGDLQVDTLGAFSCELRDLLLGGGAEGSLLRFSSSGHRLSSRFPVGPLRKLRLPSPRNVAAPHGSLLRALRFQPAR